MVTTTQDRPGEVCHIMGFNPVHKPVMVTTRNKPYRCRPTRNLLSIPFTNRSWLQPSRGSLRQRHAPLPFNPVHKPVMVTTDGWKAHLYNADGTFQSRSQTGHGYNTSCILLFKRATISVTPLFSIPFTNRSWLQHREDLM